MITSLWLGAAPAAGVAWFSWAVRGRTSQVFAPSVHRGARDRQSVALTFDDGPSESTPQLLEVLAREGVPATFFFCGRNVRRLPEAAREAAAAGHEIGNHTENHARLWLRSGAFVREEVMGGQRTIEEICGVTPRWFRAPYGVRWPGLAAAQREAGLTGVMWTVIGRDWKLSSEGIAERLLGGACGGAILCLHDGRGVMPDPDIAQTLQAVRRVIPALRDRGYHFETVSQILCPTKTT
jgi:peptidoglycan/xylan/chitin deacetylase (PgdA/CDA1 family)